MPLVSPGADLRALAQQCGNVLRPPGDNQVLVRVTGAQPLCTLAAALKDKEYYLVTMAANDERELEDGCFKIHYVFSHPTEDLFLLVEFLLDAAQEAYPSLYPWFNGSGVFEREMRDMFGLSPFDAPAGSASPGGWLHAAYPPNLWPLRRDRSLRDLRQRVIAYNSAGLREDSGRKRLPEEGSVLFPVGPIHAGLIEPGRFVFHVAGETIDDLEIKLGYTHRGIERLFQSQQTLADGWQLAEQVSGDSSFAHGLAYCLAAEALAGCRVSAEADMLRALFLELERIYNHVGDVAALAHDVALETLGSDLAVIREGLLRLNQRCSGHRLLRHINRVGGVVLPAPLDAAGLAASLSAQLERFSRLTAALLRRSDFRNRSVGAGVLSRGQALSIGATGLAARGSGLARDYRRDHPWGLYRQPWLRQILTSSGRHLAAGLEAEASRGDVYARFLTRLSEVTMSWEIIRQILQRWEKAADPAQSSFCRDVSFDSASNYDFALGYVEGWRGDIVYWLMQDKLESIYRCKVRDPSMLNWEALRRSVIPRSSAVEGAPPGGRPETTILADFPLINKSFNLSYAGHDL